MKRVLLLVALVAGMILLTPAGAMACSCRVLTPAQKVHNADTVVDGTVAWEASNGLDTTYSVKVKSLFKGKAAQREKLLTNASEASCGLGDLAPDKRYLFFIRGEHPGQMRIDLCGGTTPYDATKAAQVQAITGAPTGPYVTPPLQPGPVDEDPINGTSVWTILGTGAVVVIALGGLLLFARRTSKR